VLIDMVRYFQSQNKLKTNAACRKPCLDKGTLITPDDLQGALKMTNTTLREGDVVIINTGWQDIFNQYPKQNALYNSGEPGITNASAKWLAEQKVIAVGADTWAVEVIPGEDPNVAFPVHQTLIPNNGIHIIENVKTDEVAEEAAKSGRATFFFNMTVPKAVGLTGTFVAPQAIF
jgi:kynurenine formamidase